MSEYQTTLLVKPEVFLYKLPPRTTSRGYRAADWGLNQWMWSGRLRLVGRSNNVGLLLEDSSSGELFAEAKTTSFPSDAVEPVLDSSRYFVLRIEDGAKNKAFIGMGFQDRSDAFDFNAALQDYYRSQQQEAMSKLEDVTTKPSVDYSIKDGQTFMLNFGQKPQQSPVSKSRSVAAQDELISPILPPPPSGPRHRNRQKIAVTTEKLPVKPSSDLDNLLL